MIKTGKVRKVAGSLVISLPKDILKLVNIKEGDQVILSVPSMTDNKLIIQNWKYYNK